MTEHVPSTSVMPCHNKEHGRRTTQLFIADMHCVPVAGAETTETRCNRGGHHDYIDTLCNEITQDSVGLLDYGKNHNHDYFGQY